MIAVISAAVNARGWPAWAAIAAAVSLVYGPSLDNAFQYDDIHSIVENPHIRNLANLDDFFWRPDMFSGDPKGAMYRPLVLASYACNYALGEYRETGYHLFNLVLHLANCLLVCALARRLTGMTAVGLAGGMLFALHPVAGEPVNYVSSRSESLSAFFSLNCLVLYVRANGSPVHYWGSVASFAAALLAKSIGLMAPLGLALYDLSGGRALWRRSKYYAAFVLVGTVYVLAVRQALQTALVEHPVRSLWVQLCTQVKVLVYYLKLLLVPTGQSVEHQIALAGGLGDGAVLAAVALMGSVGFWLLALWRRAPAVGFWTVWPALFLLPTIVVPLNVLANEHRLYLPALGFSVLCGWVLLVRVGGNRGWIVCATMALAFGALAVQRSQVWRTPTALWADALAKGPLMPRPHLYMGDQYKGEGRNEEALKSYDRALKVNPALLSGGDLLVIHNNTGAAYLALGRSEEAMATYRHALAIDPDYQPAREALEALEALGAVAWDPAAEARYQSGMRLLVAGQLERAIAQLRSGLDAQRHPKLYHGLALAFERSGDPRAAIASYRAILGLPNVPESLAAGARQRLAALAGEEDVSE